MNAEHTYDIMVNNVKKNDAYHMLDTPHNELHGITLMVTSCKLLSLFASIINMDKISSAQVAPDTSCLAPPANAVGDDLPIADFATREGVRAYAPWEEQPVVCLATRRLPFHDSCASSNLSKSRELFTTVVLLATCRTVVLLATCPQARQLCF